jgi:chromosome segregation ATPase
MLIMNALLIAPACAFTATAARPSSRVRARVSTPPAMALPAVKYTAAVGGIGSAAMALWQWRSACEKKAKLDEMETALIAMSDDFASVSNQLSTTEQQRDQLSTTLIAERASKTELESDLAYERSSSAGLQSELASMTKSLKEQKDAVVRTEREVREKEAARTDLQKKLTAVGTQVTSLEGELRAVEQRLKSEVAARAGAKGQVAEAAAAQARSDDALSKLQAECDEKETAIAAALKKAADLSAELASTSSKLEEAVAEREKVVAELASVQVTLASLREGLSAKEAEVCSIEEGASELSCMLEGQARPPTEPGTVAAALALLNRSTDGRLFDA